MASAHDVASYILKKQGSMDTWKLQKLAYYSQAWHLVWESEPLFKARIEAWANGPVVRALFDEHRGQFKVGKWPKGKSGNLTAKEKESIDVVIKHYGKRTGFALRELTHEEPPWRDARGDLPPGVSCDREITRDAMYAYYGSL